MGRGSAETSPHPSSPTPIPLIPHPSSLIPTGACYASRAVSQSSEPSELAAALLAADESTRLRLLREAEPGPLDAAITALGHRHEPAAAAVLDLIDQTVDDRARRKAARRELHRLRSAGVEPPPRVAAASDSPTATEPSVAQPQAAVTEAWATDIDPTGSRALWLLGERALGGGWLAALLLNDQTGLEELALVDSTRKRFLRELDERRREGTWISLPGAYALHLVREAVDLTRERGGGLPTRYRAFRDVFGEAAGGPERALVYETINPVEASFNPDWLDDSARLVREPELAGWHLAVPPSLRARTLEVARAPAAVLLVPTHPPEQQARELLAEAAEATLTPAVRRGLQRRLEETAYVFIASERLGAARLAVAAARALEERGLPVERQPLVRALVEGGLARLVQNESVAGRPAADVLVELLERAAERRGEGPGAVETRPSGLILPR